MSIFLIINSFDYITNPYLRLSGSFLPCCVPATSQIITMFGRGINASLLVSCVLAFCFHFPASLYFRPLEISRGKQNMRRSLQKSDFIHIRAFWAVGECAGWWQRRCTHWAGRRTKGPLLLINIDPRLQTTQKCAKFSSCFSGKSVITHERRRPTFSKKIDSVPIKEVYGT
jgi:hypothetical protein